MKEKIFFDRELSWISFNQRVLQEAKDHSVPLYERIKFLAIYSSNLDEFFRVRVASLRSLLNLKNKTKAQLSFKPQQLLNKIIDTVSSQQEEFGKIFREDIIPELNKENIFILNEKNISEIQKDYVKGYFLDQVRPFVQPSLLDKNRVATFLHNRAIYLTARLKSKKTSKSNKNTRVRRFKYAIVEIPANKLNRFVTLPSDGDKNYMILLDDVIRLNLSDLFPGYNIDCSYSIKLTRDAELYIDDEFSGDLLSKIKKGLSKRRIGVPSRFLYDKDMPKDFLNILKHTLALKKDDLIQGGKYHNFNDFFSFPGFNKPHLEYNLMPPLHCKDLDGVISMFDVLAQKDIFLSYPYQSFGYVLKFLEECAEDENVNSIKITLYRVAENSHIVRALIKAAENGKQVTAFVEVKARFDEETNFISAEMLEKAGAKVYFSFPGLKVHSKLCLIERTEKGKNKYYSYLSTGNFNEKTARIYSDHGLLTSDQNLGNEINKVFNFLERKSQKEKFNHLLVAPFNLRKKLIKMIEQEISIAKSGRTALIILKLNSLEDKKMIKKLYEASQAGVQIKLIIRGICCLVPGIKRLSENIEIISIVDRFLEHARVYIFHNNGDKKYFLSSADWMKRNLSRRVEVAFPIYDVQIQKQLNQIIEIQLRDNQKSRIIDHQQINKYCSSNDGEKIRSQYEIYHTFK